MNIASSPRLVTGKGGIEFNSPGSNRKGNLFVSVHVPLPYLSFPYPPACTEPTVPPVVSGPSNPGTEV